MTHEVPPSPPPEAYFPSALDWQSIWIHHMLKAQDDHWRLIAAWQRVVSEINQDLWDRWSCRFGGGVPLDG
jgi:hypothetical protein